MPPSGSWFGLASRSLRAGISVMRELGASQRLVRGMRGQVAPDFVAPDQHGMVHRLRDQRGHIVVLFFYPKDATPGCTREVCAFRDAWKDFSERGVRVFGMSTDDQRSHATFAREHGLSFPLLADPAGTWRRAYRVPSMRGMARRVTFVIAGNGTVASVYPDVDPGTHAAQILQDLSALTPH